MRLKLQSHWVLGLWSTIFTKYHNCLPSDATCQTQAPFIIHLGGVHLPITVCSHFSYWTLNLAKRIFLSQVCLYHFFCSKVPQDHLSSTGFDFVAWHPSPPNLAPVLGVPFLTYAVFSSLLDCSSSHALVLEPLCLCSPSLYLKSFQSKYEKSTHFSKTKSKFDCLHEAFFGYSFRDDSLLLWTHSILHLTTLRTGYLAYG